MFIASWSLACCPPLCNPVIPSLRCSFVTLGVHRRAPASVPFFLPFSPSPCILNFKTIFLRNAAKWLEWQQNKKRRILLHPQWPSFTFSYFCIDLLSYFGKIDRFLETWWSVEVVRSVYMLDRSHCPLRNAPEVSKGNIPGTEMDTGIFDNGHGANTPPCLLGVDIFSFTHRNLNMY